MSVPDAVAREALELRSRRRTGAGWRWRSWRQIADELERRGRGRHRPTLLAMAVRALPPDAHPAAGPTAAQYDALEASWRAGWAEEHPGEPWPGVRAAQRLAREALFSRAAESVSGLQTREEFEK